MIYQLASSMALAAPLNMVSTIYVCAQDTPLLHKKIALGIICGLYLGTIPSLVFELSRIGMNYFVPKLFAKIPLALSIIARAIVHLVMPLISIFLLDKLPKNIHKLLMSPLLAADRVLETKTIRQ